MSKNLQLRVDTPCSQNWNEMSTTALDKQTRFCGSCVTVVTDFTNMTDQELLRWFAKPKDHVCGRFLPDQLNRALSPTTERKMMPKGFWRLLLAGLLFSAETDAQSSVDHPKLSWQDKQQDLALDTIPTAVIVGTVAHAPNKNHLPDTLRGQLIDMNNHQPIPYGTVMIDDRHGVALDSNGHFAIPRNMIGKQTILTVTAIGYERAEVNINKTWINGEVKLIPIMTRATVLGGAVTVVRRIKQPSLLKKTTAFAKDSLAYIGLVKPVLTVFPNPVARGASITLAMRLDQAGTYTAQLFNNAGASVQTLTVEADRSSKTVVMTIPATTATGVYFVRLSHPNLKKVYTQQVIIW